MPDNNESQWHLDKRIPVVLIVAILGNTAGFAWWASNMNSRVTHVERMQLQSSGDSGQIIQIKEQLRGIERIVQRLEQYLDNRRTEKTDRQYPRVQ